MKTTLWRLLKIGNLLATFANLCLIWVCVFYDWTFLAFYCLVMFSLNLWVVMFYDYEKGGF
jgi:hypothetical protein